MILNSFFSFHLFSFFRVRTDREVALIPRICIVFIIPVHILYLLHCLDLFYAITVL
jgi:hypothetical protein